MADVKYDLVVSDQVAAPLREAAAAAQASADAHDEATAASRQAADAARAQAAAEKEAQAAADAAAAAQARLRDVVLAVASAEERARAMHERRREEILRLTAVAGDQAAGDAALAANDKVLANEMRAASEQTAAAQRKLHDMALGVASAEERARVAHARRREEILRLGETAKDATATQAALAANDRALAAALMGGAGATDRAARATGGLGRALQAVGQQMPDVITQLQMGANPMTVLTQQGGQVVEVLTYTAGGAGGVVAAFSALIPMLVTVAAGIGAVVLAFRSWNGELEANQAAIDEANMQARLASNGYERLKNMLEDTRKTLRELKVATGEIPPEQAKLAEASEQAYARWQDSTRETRLELQELQKEQASTSTQIINSFRSMIEAIDEFAGFDPTADLGAFDYIFTTGSEIAGRIEVLNGVMKESVDEVKQNADGHKELIKAQGEKEDHDRSGSAAAKAAAEAERDRQRALEATHKAMTAASEAAGALIRGPLSERDRLIAAADSLYEFATAAGTSARQAFMLEEQIQQLLDKVAEIDAAPEIALRVQVGAAVDALTKGLDDAIVQGVIVGGRLAAQEIERQRLTIADALGVVGSAGQGRLVAAVGDQMMSAGFAKAISGGRGGAMAGVGAALSSVGGAVSAGVAAVRVVAGLDKMEAGIKAVSAAALENLKHLDTILPGIIDALGMAAGQILANLPEILAGLVTGIVRGLIDLSVRLLDGLKALGRTIVAGLLPGNQAGEPTKSTEEKINRGAGAVLGGVAGFVLGGPVGAVAGAAAGAAIAEKVAEVDRKLHNLRVSSASEPGQMFQVQAPAGAPAPTDGPRRHVTINVHARPMVALDRQGGAALTSAIVQSQAVYRLNDAVPARRTR